MPAELHEEPRRNRKDDQGAVNGKNDEMDCNDASKVKKTDLRTHANKVAFKGI